MPCSSDKLVARKIQVVTVNFLSPLQGLKLCLTMSFGHGQRELATPEKVLIIILLLIGMKVSIRKIDYD